MAEQLIYGVQAVAGLLRRAPERVLSLMLERGLGAGRRSRLPAVDTVDVPVEWVDAATLERLCGSPKHQGVAARIRGQALLGDQQARDLVAGLHTPLLLLLDGVQDPRNFGACLRVADGAGVDLVVVGRNRNVGVTPVVSKVAAGAAEAMSIAAVANLARFMGWLQQQGIRLIGADDEAGTELFQAELTGPLGLVLGAEGQGLRQLTRQRCDLLVRLPMRGSVASLNVAVAAGVCLYEALRQRG